MGFCVQEVQHKYSEDSEWHTQRFCTHDRYPKQEVVKGHDVHVVRRRASRVARCASPRHPHDRGAQAAWKG
jgi:hypothetical protein